MSTSICAYCVINDFTFLSVKSDWSQQMWKEYVSCYGVLFAVVGLFLIQTENVVRKVWTKNKIKYKKNAQKVKPTSVNITILIQHSDIYIPYHTHILMLSTIIKKSKCLVSKRLIAHIFHSATFRQLYWLFNTFYKLRKDILVVLVFHQHG